MGYTWTFKAPRGATASRVALLGGGICFPGALPPKMPPFSRATLEKVGTLENVGNFSPGFGNVGNFFS